MTLQEYEGPHHTVSLPQTVSPLLEPLQCRDAEGGADCR